MSVARATSRERAVPGPRAGRDTTAGLGGVRDFAFLAEVARTGGGVALLPVFLVAQDVALGELVRVLPSVAFRDAPLFLVSRPGRLVPPRVQAFKRCLLEALSQP